MDACGSPTRFQSMYIPSKLIFGAIILFYLRIISGCFSITTTELTHYNRDNPVTFTSNYTKVCQSLLQVNVYFSVILLNLFRLIRRYTSFTNIAILSFNPNIHNTNIKTFLHVIIFYIYYFVFILIIIITDCDLLCYTKKSEKLL